MNKKKFKSLDPSNEKKEAKGNKGSRMSGNNSWESKIHRKIKKALRSRL